MPTYEYACKSCGQNLEVVQKFTDAALTECPNCGGELRKVFGSVGIAFKGSGFYKNDSRPATKSSSSSSTSSTDTKTEAAPSSSSSSSESKADAKPTEKKTSGSDKAAS